MMIIEVTIRCDHPECPHRIKANAEVSRGSGTIANIETPPGWSCRESLLYGLQHYCNDHLQAPLP